MKKVLFLACICMTALISHAFTGTDSTEKAPLIAMVSSETAAIETEVSLYVYNPDLTKDTFRVLARKKGTEDQTGKWSVSVTDSLGKPVKTVDFYGNEAFVHTSKGASRMMEIDYSNLSPGIYFLTVRGKGMKTTQEEVRIRR